MAVQQKLAEHQADRLSDHVTQLLQSQTQSSARERELRLELKQAIEECAETESKVGRLGNIRILLRCFRLVFRKRGSATRGRECVGGAPASSIIRIWIVFEGLCLKDRSKRSHSHKLLLDGVLPFINPFSSRGWRAGSGVTEHERLSTYSHIMLACMRGWVWR